MKKSDILPALMTLVFSAVFFVAVWMVRNMNEESPIVLSDVYFGNSWAIPMSENTLTTLPQFSHLAFAEAPQKDHEYLSQFASVSRAFKLLFSEEIEKREEYGTWLWTPVLQMDEDYMRSIISEAKSEGVNVIYQSVDSYLDIFVMPEGPEKQEFHKKFSDMLNQFIALANENGLEVDAEAGWRNWVQEKHGYKPFAIVNFVMDFNRTSAHKFRGFQYDVEPYLLPEFAWDEAGKKIVLQKFVKLVDNTLYYLQDSDLKFSIVLPDFYDKRDKATPKFEYKARKDFVFRHLLNVLEKREGSSVIIMSYRNFAEGHGGSIDVTKNEMKTARQGRFNTRIIVAQETGNVPPPYITFHHTSRNYFKEEIGKLRSAFSSHRNWGGLAIHYANAYFTLK